MNSVYCGIKWAVNIDIYILLPINIKYRIVLISNQYYNEWKCFYDKISYTFFLAERKTILKSLKFKLLHATKSGKSTEGLREIV